MRMNSNFGSKELITSIGEEDQYNLISNCIYAWFNIKRSTEIFRKYISFKNKSRIIKYYFRFIEDHKFSKKQEDALIDILSGYYIRLDIYSLNDKYNMDNIVFTEVSIDKYKKYFNDNNIIIGNYDIVFQVNTTGKERIIVICDTKYKTISIQNSKPQTYYRVYTVYHTKALNDIAYAKAYV